MTRQIFGTVKRNGSPFNNGSNDWRSAPNGNASYQVTFNSPMAHTPVVVVSGNGQGGHSLDNAYMVCDENQNGFVVKTMDVSDQGAMPSGAMDAASFSFIAIES